MRRCWVSWSNAADHQLTLWAVGSSQNIYSEKNSAVLQMLLLLLAESNCFQPICWSGFVLPCIWHMLNFCLHQNCIEVYACMLLHFVWRFFVLPQHQGYVILGFSSVCYRPNISLSEVKPLIIVNPSRRLEEEMSGQVLWNSLGSSLQTSKSILSV